MKTGITVASVWVAAPVRDLTGNDTLLFEHALYILDKTVEIIERLPRCKSVYGEVFVRET